MSFSQQPTMNKLNSQKLVLLLSRLAAHAPVILVQVCLLHRSPIKVFNLARA